jgi:hypothetical protein
MKILKRVARPLLLLSAFLLILSCDEEFNALESDVLGDNNFNFNTPRVTVDVLAYNANIEAQQINSLPSYLLGHFNDPIYGPTTASVVTQIAPSTADGNTITGNDLRIESVVLQIPYFVSRSTDANRQNIFSLDSLFITNNDLSRASSIKLSVFQNNFFLRDFDPNLPEDTQTYFSRANAGGEDNIALVNNSEINFDTQAGMLLYENDDFNIVRDTIVILDSLASGVFQEKPVLQAQLSESDELRAFWSSLILEADEAILSDPSRFQNFFRGLYIKASPNGNVTDSNMAMLDFLDEDAEVIVNYSRSVDSTANRENDSFRLNFSGVRLNTFINNFNANTLPTSPNTIDGDASLFLKGTQGAVSVVQLFDDELEMDCNCGNNSNGEPIIVRATALDCFKKSFRQTDDEGNILPAVNGRFELKRLINEAQLIVYEDNQFVTNTTDPNGDAFNASDRLYIYNADTNDPILDYITDPRIAGEDPENLDPLISRTFSLGTRTTTEVNGERLSFYRLRLTDHLNNILVNNAVNPDLGLTVTNNVNISITTPVLNATNDIITEVPSNTVITPRGTVLVGSNNQDPTTRIRLELFTTEPR